MARWLTALCVFGVGVGVVAAKELGNHGIMPVTPEALAESRMLLPTLPEYEPLPGYIGEPGAVNLLTNVVYVPALRNQGRTGSCWMWGCQAVMWIDYARQFPEAGAAMTNGFSLQFMSSYLRVIDEKLNMGGTPWTFMRFHRALGYAIPWSNRNAAWTDGVGYVATPPAFIYTQPRIPVASMKLTAVKTFGEPAEDAITRIKSVLDSGRAMYFNMMLANDVEWDKFLDFWGKSDATENTLFTNYVSGETINFTTGGAHLMACVGYDDTDPDPAQHYWIILNSWSTGDNPDDTRRPNGVWRLPMQVDYSAYTYDFMADKQAAMFEWGILETTFADYPTKGVEGIHVRLGGTDQSQNVIELKKGTVTAPGVIDHIDSVTIYVNERYYQTDPDQGVWRQVSPTANTPPKGHIYEYQSNAGVEPSIWLQVDVLDKTWSFRITGLGPDDHRFISLHDGLYFSATFDRGGGAGHETLAEHRGFAFDELDSYTQDSGHASSGNPTGSLMFTQPAPGTEVPVGSVCVIEWEQEGLDGKMVSIELTGFGEYRDASLTLAGMVPVEAGRVEWVVPRDIWLGSNHTVVAVVGAENPIFSGPSITLVDSSDPALVVRAPVGGEGWTTGSTRRISWEGYNLEGDVTIELLADGLPVPGSAVQVPVSDEGFLYALPEDLAPGTYAVQFSIDGLAVTSAAFNVTGQAPGIKPWSVLIYSQADNNLEPSLIEDFLDVARVGSTSNMNVLVQMDRIGGYHVGYDNWTGAKRYYMTNGITPTIANAVQDLGEVSMTRPGTLLDFIYWSVENYPAEHYFLILADHGDGWQGGLWESTPNMVRTPQPMGLFEAVLKASPAPMTIVGFDACLMGQIESAYQLRDTGTGIFIGSQYVETMGWAYTEFLQELDDSKGQIDPWALATRVSDLSVGKYPARDPAALTVVDLSRMDGLATAMAGFTATVLADPEDRTAIRAQAGVVSSNYHAAIIHHAANRMAELSTSGLNIYFREDRLLAPDYVHAGLDFTTDARWVEFLQAYTNTLHASWIGEARRFIGGATDIDLMSFIHAIRPPGDAAWLSFSTVGNGNIEGRPLGVNVMARQGDALALVAIGAEPQHMMPGTRFVRWWVGGDATLSDPPTSATNTLTVNGHATIIAYFADEQDEYRVTFTPIGSGTINGLAEEFSVTIPSGGSTVPVVAHAAAGHTFAGWGGAIESMDNPLVIENVLSDLSVFAFFWPVPEQWSDHADTGWWQSGQTTFSLSTAGELAGLAALVNNGTDSFAGKTVTLAAPIDLTGRQWTPIGHGAHSFAGHFNGNFAPIMGLTIEKTAADDSLGLFGSVTVEDGDILIEKVMLGEALIVGGSFIGGVVGQAYSENGTVTIRDCFVQGTVYGHGGLVGGIVGEAATGDGFGRIGISNCFSQAHVSGKASTGGIVGRALGEGDVILTLCMNMSPVVGAIEEVGGIVGSLFSISGSAALTRCGNFGPVTAGANTVGGVAGRVGGSDVTIDFCRNIGPVTITGVDYARAGGVVGAVYAMLPRILNCVNSGDVHGHDLVGGVAGLTTVSLENCANHGWIEGRDRVGGLAGALHGNSVAAMANVMNAGVVAGVSRVGGIAGQIASENAASAEAAYFRQSASVNSTLPFVGEMIPATNLVRCATFADADGVLSAPGHNGNPALLHALNFWVAEHVGYHYWETDVVELGGYPDIRYGIAEVDVSFDAHGGTFPGGHSVTNVVYVPGEPYGSFPPVPSNAGQSFAGWWYEPAPGLSPMPLRTDALAIPSIEAVEARWSGVTAIHTPLTITMAALAGYYPEVLEMDQTQVDTLANGPAANGRDRVWELIFLGLDPVSADTIAQEVRVYATTQPLQIHAIPGVPVDGAYILEGKAALDDDVWVDCGPLGSALPEDHRFFRVKRQP